MMNYREQVQVYSEDGSTLFGTATFVGGAVQNRIGGLWSWRGRLTNASFEPGEVWDAKTVQLKFADGATARAICAYSPMRRSRFIIGLTGDGPPPRIEAD